MSPTELQALKQQPASVPCGTCRACCKQDLVHLNHEKDNLSAFKWHMEFGRHTLDRKPNGECIYLTERGCSVHDAPPDICKRMDCRVLFLTTPKAQRRIRIQQNPTMAAVYEAGKTRANTLTQRKEDGYHPG